MACLVQGAVDFTRHTRSHAPQDMVCWDTTKWEKETSDTICCFMNAPEHFCKLTIPEAELTRGLRMTGKLMGFCFTTKYVRCRCALTHSYISFMAHKIHRCIAPSVNETTTAMIFNKLILAFSFFPMTVYRPLRKMLFMGFSIYTYYSHS